MDQMTTQDAYWNKVAAVKTFAHPIDLRRVEKLMSREAVILDYGCGYGRTCAELFHAGYSHVMGVDTSEQMIARGRREYPELNLRVLKEVELKYAAYDMVILFTVLTCVPDDASQRLLMSEVRRMLKPGGVVHISDLWIQGDRYHTAQYAERQTERGEYGVFDLPEGATFRHHSRDWIDRLLMDFEMIELYDTDVVTMNGNPALGFQYFGRRPWR